MSNPTEGNILSIESAISGGSLALYRDGVEIDKFIGNADVSRAEDLLPNIDDLLRRNSIQVEQLATVAVSSGPGSFTGIRIGIATGLGLTTPFGITLRQISLLEAIAYGSEMEGDLLVALPVGRGTVCMQQFTRDKTALNNVRGPYTMSIAEFAELLRERGGPVILCHKQLHDSLGGVERGIHQLVPCLAAYLARATAGSAISDSPEPLFISKQTSG